MTVYDIGACPVCQKQEFRTIADEAEIKSQMERLWEFHIKRLHAGAPIQQLFDRAIFSQKPPLNVSACIDCGTVLRNPRESDDEVVETYAEEEPSTEALNSLFDAQRRFYEPRVDRLTRWNQGPGSVLEVGSYIGGFLDAAREKGWTGHGIDVNEKANAYARKKNLEVTQTTLEEFTSDGTYDVVCLWNLFDQLPDPRGTLHRAKELLKPNGLVTLRVPNGACYSALIGRKQFQSLLAHNNLLGFPYRHGFTTKSLRMLLQEASFEVVDLRGDVLVSTAGPWTKKWAVVEERVLKRAMKRLLPKRLAPWIEVYARLTYS